VPSPCAPLDWVTDSGIMELKDKIVVITGSGQGLGKAFARRILQDGAKVCLSDIQETLGLTTKKQLQEEFGLEKIHFVRCDVTKYEELTALYDEAESFFKDKVDIWCNNAGVNHTLGWKKCMDIDIMAVMAGTYLAIDRMNKQKGGRGGLIVNTASIAGILSGAQGKEIADANSYFVAKHGVVALTRALANPEMEAETGVKLQCICPMFADTNIIREGLEADVVRGKIETLYGLMTPEFVAEGFRNLIVECGSGAALSCVKDVPFFTVPDISEPLVILLSIGAKIFGVRVFQWHHQILFGILLFLLAHFLLGLILSFIF